MDRKNNKQSKEAKTFYIDLINDINQERKYISEQRNSILKSINELNKDNGIYNHIITMIDT